MEEIIAHGHLVLIICLPVRLILFCLTRLLNG